MSSVEGVRLPSDAGLLFSPRHARASHVLAATLLLLVLVAGVGWADFVTGPLIGFSLFYLGPIVYAGWRIGKWPAFTIAVASSIAWFLADIGWQQADHYGVSVWNGFTRLGIYVAMGLLTARVRADRSAMESVLREMTALAKTDPLTKLCNSRSFFETVQVSLRNSSPSDRHSLVYIDVDNFKKVNDTSGHESGDAVLRAIALLLEEGTGDRGVVARLGGDEFAIALAGQSVEAVDALARRLVEETKAIGLEHPGSGLSLSMGIVHAMGPCELEDLLHRADAAMYESKRARKSAGATREA
jgi:diguanylate cyclase (GGDEF)-like protein